MMLRRRAMYRGGELPAGYQLCNYLESTGTQTINTGLTPVYGDEINVIAYRTSNANSMFYASGTVTITSSTGKFYCRYFTSTKNNAIEVSQGNFPADAQYHHIMISQDGFYADGNFVRPLPGERAEAGTLIIFRGTSNYGKLRIKRFYITRDGAYTLNLIPALDRNGTPCMYDTVSKQTFYNERTGDFLYELA